MNARKILAATLAGACLLTVTNDLSAQRGKRVEAIFKKLDANSDGKITKDEAGKRWDRLSKADANDDGAVTLEELKAAFSKRRRR